MRYEEEATTFPHAFSSFVDLPGVCCDPGRKALLDALDIVIIFCSELCKDIWSPLIAEYITVNDVELVNIAVKYIHSIIRS